MLIHHKYIWPSRLLLHILGLKKSWATVIVPPLWATPGKKTTFVVWQNYVDIKIQLWSVLESHPKKSHHGLLQGTRWSRLYRGRTSLQASKMSPCRRAGCHNHHRLIIWLVKKLMNQMNKIQLKMKRKDEFRSTGTSLSPAQWWGWEVTRWPGSTMTGAHHTHKDKDK